jgi:hypothetical protein
MESFLRLIQFFVHRIVPAHDHLDLERKPSIQWDIQNLGAPEAELLPVGILHKEYQLSISVTGSAT